MSVKSEILNLWLAWQQGTAMIAVIAFSQLASGVFLIIFAAIFLIAFNFVFGGKASNEDIFYLASAFGLLFIPISMKGLFDQAPDLMRIWDKTEKSL